ncbi:ABC transporter ATP-binding protein [Dehalobacter sp. DCM]|uniref:ABC transporter ATP-binding protein n=1 Tax=Dehalobacter sp. DCM TaxID=2907827 RepID=UPI003081B8BD|nr:ABC transporter ATP-binding protein [Dehalobacter sp. DCM]
MKNEIAFVMNKVNKNFSSGKQLLKVLEDVSLEIEEGELVALLGPSGCGKSTLINLAACFEKPDDGQVLFMGRPITMPSPQRGVVFQSAQLFPWLTVKQNISYGLTLQKQKKEIIEDKCSKYIQLVKLEGFEYYYPPQLSGGMQQRVALARVLIMEPRMLLMDEPFAALDAQTRLAMQQLLLSIAREIEPTVLFVTHDVEEALFLADKVLVMSRLPGRIIHEVKVPFQRPRPISLIGSTAFSKLKRSILALLNI